MLKKLGGLGAYIYEKYSYISVMENRANLRYEKRKKSMLEKPTVVLNVILLN